MDNFKTPPKAIRACKEKDPSFPVTERTLRKWMNEGKVYSVSLGRTRLVSMESLEDYLRAPKN